MKVIDRQIYFWAHMLDEAFGSSTTFQQMSQRDISDALKHGIPSKMKAYDMFYYNDEHHEFIVAGWKDFPQHWFCVINVYVSQHAGDKFYVLNFDIIRSVFHGNEDIRKTLGDSVSKMLDLLSEKYHVWMFERNRNSTAFINKTFEDVEWDVGVIRGTKTDFEDYAYSLDDVKVMNGIAYPDMFSYNDTDVAVAVWWQKRKIDSMPIKQLLAKEAQLDIDRIKSQTSQSYFAMWSQNAKNSVNSICKEIAKKFDARVHEVFGIQPFVKGVCELINQIGIGKHTVYDIASLLQSNYDLSRLVDRKSWWRLIPDQTYRAMVSRTAHPDKSRGVSLKVVHECLDRICFDIMQLYIQSNDSIIQCKVIPNSKVMSQLSKYAKQYKAYDEIMRYLTIALIDAAGSYVDKSTYEYDVNDSDESFTPMGDSSEHETFGEVFQELNRISANETNMQFLIAQISKIVDWAHYRGSLAGVFIEGGSKTCSQVSNMKPDEMYESGLRVHNAKHLVTEGKHWPRDYAKTAFDLVKSSPIGQQSWYADEYIRQDVETFVNEFENLAKKNSNLGFFMAVIRWFIEYAGTSPARYEEFITRKLDKVIAGLLKIRRDKGYDSQAEAIKKMPFDQFMRLVDKVNSSSAPADQLVTASADAQYEVVPIHSYRELNSKYGGSMTGYKGSSEWCHTASDYKAVSTYNKWTDGGTKMFFVIQRKDWRRVKAPDVLPENPYDDYGMSLIAILVDVSTNELVNSTSRYNHEPKPASGATDIMFETWDQLNNAVGMDVESICKQECAKLSRHSAR